jgi:predicted alpha/beta superfamily hydrolase
MQFHIWVFLLFLFVSPTIAQVTVVKDSLFSPSINSTMKVCVVLPDGYSKETEHYTTVYLLHGYNQNYTD